jgi:hypothetical protein
MLGLGKLGYLVDGSPKSVGIAGSKLRKQISGNASLADANVFG